MEDYGVGPAICFAGYCSGLTQCEKVRRIHLTTSTVLRSRQQTSASQLLSDYDATEQTTDAMRIFPALYARQSPASQAFAPHSRE
ncbi:hypothetical protein AT984_13075 [Paucibacter sp. KCTC 42545]|nr:hypothetical protein AT984_13075 [Paucibacter sp. KCTC 42545]